MKKLRSTFFFILILTFFASLASQQAYGQVKINTPVNFTVTDTHGNQHTLFDYLDDGKYVLIDFFFTTCGSCIASMPSLNEAYERYGCNQGDIVFIALDRGNTNAQVVAYKNAYGGYYPSASGIDGHADDAVTAYGVTAFPTVTLIAPNHTFISKDIYPVTKTNLDKAIHTDAGLPFNPNACNATNTHHLLKKKAELNLYPNPVINTASIQIDVVRAMDIKVKIINVLGQTINTPIDSTLAEPTTKTVDFRQFRPGIYFIQLISNGQVISTQRFSKITP